MSQAPYIAPLHRQIKKCQTIASTAECPQVASQLNFTHYVPVVNILRVVEYIFFKLSVRITKKGIVVP